MSTVFTSKTTEAHNRLILEPGGSKDVYSEFNYYLPPADGPSEPGTNDLELILGTKDQDTRRLHVLDVRGREDVFTLDKNGFRYVRMQSKMQEWETEDAIKELYNPELEDMLKREL